jgi:hypothetical protein
VDPSEVGLTNLYPRKPAGVEIAPVEPGDPGTPWIMQGLEPGRPGHPGGPVGAALARGLQTDTEQSLARHHDLENGRLVI